MFKKGLGFIVFLLGLFFLGCGKKSENIKLAQSYYRLALLEVGEAEYKKSLDYLNKAIVENSKPEYLALKATVLFRLGKEEEGEVYFQKALDANPDYYIRADIMNNKACLLAQMGILKDDDIKINAALAIWDELENDENYLTPEVAFFNQSKVYLNKKEYYKSAELLNKAINASPNYLDAHFYLALIAFNNLNDFSLARRELATVLFLEANHHGAKKLSKMLQK
ncbi:tetratricopeptide repeat protein [Candidatus Dependentiae bacterium]